MHCFDLEASPPVIASLSTLVQKNNYQRKRVKKKENGPKKVENKKHSYQDTIYLGKYSFLQPLFINITSFSASSSTSDLVLSTLIFQILIGVHLNTH